MEEQVREVLEMFWSKILKSTWKHTEPMELSLDGGEMLIDDVKVSASLFFEIIVRSHEEVRQLA